MAGSATAGGVAAGGVAELAAAGAVDVAGGGTAVWAARRVVAQLIVSRVIAGHPASVLTLGRRIPDPGSKS